MSGALALGVVQRAAAAESLDWKPDGFVLVSREKTGWKGVKGNETWRQIYAKPGVTSENWTEKAEVTEFPIAITLGSSIRWNPESVMNSEKARLAKSRCSTEAWTLLNKDASSIAWAWDEIRCPGYLHQHEIVRVVMGRWSLWMISYGIRNREFPDDERATLLEDLMKAKVVKKDR